MDVESTSDSQLIGDTTDTHVQTTPRERPSSIALDMDYSSSNTLSANGATHEQLRPSLSRIADPPPTESAGAAQNIRYTIGRLLNEVSRVRWRLYSAYVARRLTKSPIQIRSWATYDGSCCPCHNDYRIRAMQVSCVAFVA